MFATKLSRKWSISFQPQTRPVCLSPPLLMSSSLGMTSLLLHWVTLLQFGINITFGYWHRTRNVILFKVPRMCSYEGEKILETLFRLDPNISHLVTKRRSSGINTPSIIHMYKTWYRSRISPNLTSLCFTGLKRDPQVQELLFWRIRNRHTPRTHRSREMAWFVIPESLWLGHMSDVTIESVSIGFYIAVSCC